jgi:CRISPR system Cascade subunit CasE
MYLSRLTLNPRSRQVQAELSNPYQMHRTLMAAFPPLLDDQERLLYRLETSHTAPYLVALVQSHLSPDWSILEHKDYLLQPAQTKPFDPHFQVGQVLAFRLVANPTKRLGSALKDVPGKRVSLYRLEQQEDWLKRKALQHGFALLDLQVASLSDQYAYKNEKDKDKDHNQSMKITHHGVRFDGLLRIEDAVPFAAALASGIGSAKGFGFGLLSLARPVL